MTQKSINHRLAMTAIAAVLAISSTPAFAQEVPDTTAESTASDPLAPDPVTTTPDTPAMTASEAAPPATKPKVEKRETAAGTASTVRRTTAAASKPSRRTASSSANALPAAPAAPATAEALAESPPQPAAPETIPVAQPIAAAPVEPQPATDTIAMDDALPIAGAAGLGLLALAGAGFAASRRRRRREDEEFEANQRALAGADAEPVPQPETVRSEPAFARTMAQEPVRASGPASALPVGFDLSRFGRHVQAAYRGPTPDNPSLSLKNRLRRASFFDQQERRAAEETKSSTPKADPAWMSRKTNGSEFMFRPAARKPSLKPALQK